MIDVLVVDDELPALSELQFLLDRDERVGTVHTARTGTKALKLLQEQRVDLVLLDIHMPGLTGLELAGVLKRFAQPPTLVFVTADASHAVEAYDLAAVDYLLKPVRAERLAETVQRVVEGLEPKATSPAPATTSAQTEQGSAAPTEAPSTATLLVTQGDSTVRIRIAEITHVTASGDYSRLHTGRGSFLERVSMNDLERRWQQHGFIRVHRSALVRLDAVEAVHRVSGMMVVKVAGSELPVARRALPRVREALSSQSLGAVRR